MSEVKEMKSLTLNGTKYDSFQDQTARAAADEKLPSPVTAKVGQYLVAAEVDADGKITKVKAVKVPTGGNKWIGKTLNFMGDSITEGYASTAKFTDIIASKLSAICNNYGIGGSTVANGQNPMYSRVLQMDEDADLCVVFGGTNDFANYDRVLGEQFIVGEGKRTLNLDTNTFYGGLNQLCTNLYSRFPYSTLVLCTPINRQSFAGQETDMQANGNGLYLDEYVEAIKKVAAYFSIPCLDLYSTVNLYPYDAANIAKYYSASDQLHPNAEGHKHIANVMLAFFDTLACKRTMVVHCTGITLNTAELALTEQGSQTLTATVTPEGCTDVITWESNNTSVATVSGGVVTAIANGSAIITAKCGEYSASCSVSVSLAEEPDEPDEPVTAGLIHSFAGAKATSTTWVDSVDPSYQFDFTGSPTVTYGIVNFSANSYGVLNKALDTKDVDTTLAIKAKMDNTMTNTWSFGVPNWSQGFILGKYSGFGLDASSGATLGVRISGDPLHSGLDRTLKLTDADSNYHVYTAKYIKSESVTYWYCDGVLVGSFGQSVITNWLSSIINLNNERTEYRGNNSFKYIKIWNRALSDDEISALT